MKCDKQARPRGIGGGGRVGKSDFQRVVGRIERRLLGEVLDHVLEETEKGK